jgi:hypothetical protein
MRRFIRLQSRRLRWLRRQSERYQLRATARLERVKRLAVGRHAVLGELPTKDRRQPAPLLGDGQMTSSLHFGRKLVQLGGHPLSRGVPPGIFEVAAVGPEYRTRVLLKSPSPRAWAATSGAQLRRRELASPGPPDLERRTFPGLAIEVIATGRSAARPKVKSNGDVHLCVELRNQLGVFHADRGKQS